VIIVIFEIYISQGSVATQLRCAGIRSNQFITNFPQCSDEKIVKIGQHLAYVAMWQKVCGLVFLAHPVVIGAQ